MTVYCGNWVTSTCIKKDQRMNTVDMSEWLSIKYRMFCNQSFMWSWKPDEHTLTLNGGVKSYCLINFPLTVCQNNITCCALLLFSELSLY